MGLSAQHPAARARPPATDFAVFSVDQVEAFRTTGLNVTCRVSRGPELGSWLRVPPLTPDQVSRGYWFASEGEAEESPYGPWAIPHAQAFSMARFVLAGFGSDQGWREDTHPRYVTDLTGDGKGDVVGFGNDGVWVSRGDGSGGFAAPAYVLAEFGVNQGWLVDQHQRFVVDLTGDGRSDLVGFGPNGVLVALGDGSGGFGAPQLVQTDDDIRYGGHTHYPRLLADLTGDGRPDLVSFGSVGVWTSLNAGDGTFGPAREALHALCYYEGWRDDHNPRFVADLTGDGRADIIAFGDQGVQVAHGRGDGTFEQPEPLVSFFGTVAMPDLAWQVGRDPRLLTDLTGNGAMDVVGFGDDGVWVLVLDTTGPRTPQFCVPDLGYSTGWREGTHHRIAADLTGDGRADLIGFGDAGVYVCLNEGAGPVPRPVLTQ